VVPVVAAAKLRFCLQPRQPVLRLQTSGVDL